jgi:ribonuclease HII
MVQTELLALSPPPSIIAGIDEVGRGALFGVVTAAAVVLSPAGAQRLRELGVKDSKQLTAKRRERLATEIAEIAIGYSVATATVAEIDRLNILWASLLAMKRAVENLPLVPDLCLVDGNRAIPDLALPQQPIVGGDRSEIAIAAASILAKVDRDRVMTAWDLHYPAYGLAKNKGYGSPQHLSALATHGATTEHRQSFAPVKMATRSIAVNS